MFFFNDHTPSEIYTLSLHDALPILSDAPTRVNILSTNPILAESAGTKEPICAMRTIRAVCLRSADLPDMFGPVIRSEEHTSELQSRPHLVCRLLLEKKK